MVETWILSNCYVIPYNFYLLFDASVPVGGIYIAYMFKFILLCRSSYMRLLLTFIAMPLWSCCLYCKTIVHTEDFLSKVLIVTN